MTTPNLDQSELTLTSTVIGILTIYINSISSLPMNQLLTKVKMLHGLFEFMLSEPVKLTILTNPEYKRIHNLILNKIKEFKTTPEVLDNIDLIKSMEEIESCLIYNNRFSTSLLIQRKQSIKNNSIQFLHNSVLTQLKSNQSTEYNLDIFNQKISIFDNLYTSSFNALYFQSSSDHMNKQNQHQHQNHHLRRSQRLINKKTQ